MQKRLMARLTSAAVAASLTFALAAPALADGTPATSTQATSTQTTATSTTQADTTLPSVSVTPSSPIYWLKSMWEHVRLTLSFSADAKANLYAQYAAERLAEAQELEAQGQMGLAAGALAEFKADVAHVSELVEQGGVSAEHAATLNAMLKISQQAAAHVLARMPKANGVAPAPQAPTATPAPAPASAPAAAPAKATAPAPTPAPVTTAPAVQINANSDAATLSLVKTEAQLAVQAADAQRGSDDESEGKDEHKGKQHESKGKHADKEKKHEDKGDDHQGNEED